MFHLRRRAGRRRRERRALQRLRRAGATRRRGHCRKCVQAAVTRAAALDSFDPGVGLCLEASIDEIQLRHALILAVNGTEAALIRDFVVRRREPDGGFVWHVPSSFLDDEELTPDAPAK
jgi:hypothetical protein